jgi:hypothetical protein
VAGTLSQIDRITGKLTAPVSADAVIMSWLPTFTVATAKALEPVFPGRLTMPSPVCVAAKATISATGVSDAVKGCKMPALDRRPVSARKYSTGRRLTSLEGGNRGTKPRGHSRQSRYGDLSCDFSVPGGKVTRRRDGNVHCRVSCIPMAAVFPLSVRARERNSMPSAKRCPYRV